MPDQTEIPVSSFPDAQSINGGDKVTGLQNNSNTNFTFSSILSWLVNAFRAVFVPVTRTVNGKTLDTNITLNASDVGARPSTWTPSVTDIGAQPAITANGILKGDGAGGVSAATAGTDYGTYSKPSGGIPSSDMTSAVQTSLGKADTAYQKPSGGIPSSDMTSGVQTSLGKADTAYQKPSGGIPASDLANGVIPTQPSDIGAQPTITASGILKGDGAGGVSAATPGTDYQAPLTAGTDYATPAQLADKANQSQLAYVETGTTASRNYAVGEYFCWNGLLYRAKTAISVGQSFTPGTNCEQSYAAVPSCHLESVTFNCDSSGRHTFSNGDLPNRALSAPVGCLAKDASNNYLNTGTFDINPRYTTAGIFISSSCANKEVTLFFAVYN